MLLEKLSKTLCFFGNGFFFLFTLFTRKKFRYRSITVGQRTTLYLNSISSDKFLYPDRKKVKIHRINFILIAFYFLEHVYYYVYLKCTILGFEECYDNVKVFN